MDTRFTRGKSNILERPLTRPKTEVSVSAFALLFSEMVQYCQSRVYSVTELQTRLADMGQSVGASMLDVLVLREKNGKRETKVLNMLLFIKVNVWKSLFGKEADKLEQANDDDKTYYIIEKEPLINAYISVPKENSSLNCAAFTAWHRGGRAHTQRIPRQGHGSLAQGHHAHDQVQRLGHHQGQGSGRQIEDWGGSRGCCGNL
ncbi:hypothetical protein KUCAC02_016800 [Chaenocephalus aceratus]|nr:hypothetical protein KUCAC02_016800 [Chaenocephalus aceratus]